MTRLPSHQFSVFKEIASNKSLDQLYTLIRAGNFSLVGNPEQKETVRIKSSTVICSSSEWFEMLSAPVEFWPGLRFNKKAGLQLGLRFEKGLKPAEHTLSRKIVHNSVKFVQIKITSRCQMKCSFCYYWKRNQELSLKQVKKAFKLSKKWPIQFILHGGEPFLHKQLKKVLQAAPSRVSFSTNGLSFPTQIDRRKIRHFSVSFDLDRFEHPNYYDKLISSIKRLPLPLQQKIVFLTVSSLHTPSEVIEAYERLRKDLRWPRIYFSIERLVSDSSPTHKKFLQELEEYKKLSNYQVTFIPKAAGRSFQPGCGFCSPMIDSDFSVRLCSKIRDFKPFSIEEFDQVFRAFDAERQRRRFVCRVYGCEFWKDCSTGGFCSPISDQDGVCSVFERRFKVK